MNKMKAVVRWDYTATENIENLAIHLVAENNEDRKKLERMLDDAATNKTGLEIATHRYKIDIPKEKIRNRY